MKKVIAIDQGTTSSRVLILDEKGGLIDKFQKDFNQIYIKDQILQDADVVFQTVQSCLDLAFSKYNKADFVAIGITNQRETTVLFDRKGKPLDYAISWQSKHTKPICESWEQLGYLPYIKKTTGLLINPYFSASKIKFLMDKHASTLSQTDDYLFGTMDTYILYKLTKGSAYYTDPSNASRTMLFNIKTGQYDDKLLTLAGVSHMHLPTVLPSNALFGYYEGIPITGILGDQQAALFGHMAFNEGDMKTTYGTGCFILMNTGKSIHRAKKGLISTIAWQIDDQITYALEGSIFVAGTSIKWLRDQLGIIKTSEASEVLARASKHTMYFVPAFAGLGAPYWDTDVRGTMFGITADVDKADIVKATLNAIAYQVKDVIQTMIADTKMPLGAMGIDGGAANNAYLMQFQSDLLRNDLIKKVETEITGIGVGYLAGLYHHFYDLNQLKETLNIDTIYKPSMSIEEADMLYEGWQKAVKVSRKFK